MVRESGEGVGVILCVCCPWALSAAVLSEGFCPWVFRCCVACVFVCLGFSVAKQ